jgi:hypothetical protein
VLFLDHPIHHHKLSVLAEVFTPSPDLRFDCKSKIDHVTGQSLIGRCVPACATVVLLSDKHVAVCVLSALYGLIFRVRDACETDLKHYSPIAVYHIFSFHQHNVQYRCTLSLQLGSRPVLITSDNTHRH